MKYVFCVLAITALLFTGSSGILGKAFAIQSIISLNEQQLADEMDRDWLIDTARALLRNGLNDGTIDEERLQSGNLEQLADTTRALVVNGLNDGTINEQQLLLQGGSGGVGYDGVGS